MGGSVRALELLAIAAVVSTSCATVDTYSGHVRTFREGYATAAPSLGELYVHLNDFEREVYFAQASCDPHEAIVDHPSSGAPTPLGADRFSAEFIQTRVDAVTLLGRYADQLMAISGDEAAQRMASTTGDLSAQFVGLAIRFSQLADATAQQYAVAVRQVVTIVAWAILAARQDDAVRTTILRGAPAVRSLLDLLEHDLSEAVRVSQSAGYDGMVTRCAGYYNANRETWSPLERRAILRQLAGIARRRAHFRTANPVELVHAMRDAHEALVRFAGAPRRGNAELAQLSNAMQLFAHRVEQTASSIRRLAADENDDDDVGSASATQ